MSSERPTLAEVLDEADNRWQHGVGASGYDPDGSPEWLADAVLAWLRDRLADEALATSLRAAMYGDMPDEQGREWLAHGQRVGTRRVLAVVAEHLGAS